MAEYVPPAERPVVKIDHPILTPQQEQDKWLAESIQAVKEKSERMRGSMAFTATGSTSGHNGLNGGAPGRGEAARNQTTRSSGGFMTVVRAAALLLDELRVSVFAPHNYYELYIAVFNEIQSFAQYVQEEHQLRRRSLEEMYEAVQYVGHILPRLYLLVSVGSVYIASGEVPALTLFRDLVEMCKGVQHTTHGLFLRHFLLTMTKNLLPGDMNRSRPNVEDEDGGTPLDTARLLLLNTREMNWLWIRMEAKWYGKGLQHVYGGKDGAAMASRRTQSDRKELQVLVGMNVVRLSQLEGIDMNVYKETVLPQLMSVVVSYREPVAQQYLLEVIIQVYPDEYHTSTLSTLLHTMCYLTPTVDVCQVLRSLMNRLGNYVVALREGRAEATGSGGLCSEEGAIDSMFSVFLEKLEQIPVSYARKEPELKEIKRSSSAPPACPIMLGAYVDIMASLAHMAAKIAPEKCTENTSAILQRVAAKLAAAPTVAEVLTQEWEAAHKEAEAHAHSRSSNGSPVRERGAGGGDGPSMPPGADTEPAITAATIATVERLIVSSVDRVDSVSQVLSMDGLVGLVGQLPFRGRHAAATTVCEAVLRKSVSTAGGVTSLEELSRLFELLDPLLCDQEDAPEDPASAYKYDPVTEFLEEQQTVCRVLHLIDSGDPILYAKMLNGVRKLLGQGGPRRVPHTFPALASLYMKAALRLYVSLKDATFAVEEERIAARAAKYQDPNRDTGDADRKERRAEEAEANKAVKAAGEDNEEGSSASPAKRAPQLSKQLSKAFKYLHSGDGKGILEMLATCENSSVTAFYIYLAAANTADTCEMPDVSYELYTEAIALYEDYAMDTKAQTEMLVGIVNALLSARSMPPDSYSALTANVCRYCSKLMRKGDQSLMAAQCANFFVKRGGGAAVDGKTAKGRAGGDDREDDAAAPEEGREGEEEKEKEGAGEVEGEEGAEGEEDQQENLMECLQRSLKVAKRVANPLRQLALYVDLLNIFLHFFASKTVRLEASHINDLLDTIRALSEAQREGGAAGPAATATATEEGGPANANEAEGRGSDESSEDDQGAPSFAGNRKGRPGTVRAVAPASAEDPLDGATAYEAIRRVYRNTTKYIRSRQSVDPRWEEIDA